MATSPNLLIPALIFVTVGILVGILIMSLVGDRRRRKDDSEQENKVMEELIVPEMPVLPETRFESIAALYRETRSGKLVTDVKGKVYLNRSSIPAEQLRSLQEAASNWQAWLGMPAQPAQVVNPAPAAPVATPEFSPAAPEPVSGMESPSPDVSTEDDTNILVPEDELSTIIPETKTELPPVETTPDLPVIPPVIPVPPVSTAKVEKPRARTMVGQIDEILQEILPGTIYAGKNIRLSEEFSNGVVVWIGAVKYIGIESVPDPEIKALIQSAVRKWEAFAGNV
ncbi:MAG TPA: hypothetical protein DCP32_10050 [Anaerolineaceae bacterium]|nr:MAG: hypothetical protein A2X24_10820 [Chloroflexi bacterium GWB2_54_36]HAL17066.1 hypothetical protein [Anaerolineaceae bacterium]